MRKFIRSSFIFLLVLIYLLSCSIFVVADTQNRKELKSVFKSVLPSFNTYVYKGDDIGIIKHLNTLSVDEETAFSAVNSFGPTDSQQSIGQSDCEIFNTKNIAVGDELTIDYFLPNPQFTYEYQLVNNNIKYQYIFTFKEIASGQYKSTFFSPDGSEDYGLYRVSGNEIEEYETGFSIPYSEYDESKVIEGRNVVFKQVAPGMGWTSKYKVKDGWESISEHSCTYTFLGFSMETILDRQVRVAKIAYSSECKVIDESEFAEWVVVPSMASGEKWYAKGVGLVRSKGVNTSFWNNETYTSEHDTNMVGYIGNGDPFISDSSIHIDKTDLILTKGKTATLTAVTNPEGIPVKWSSSDNNVATVKYRDNTCEITAIAEGNVTITAEITVDGKKLKDTCDLSVIKSSPEDIAAAYAKYLSDFVGDKRERTKTRMLGLEEDAELTEEQEKLFLSGAWCSAFVGETARAFGLSKIIPLRSGVGGLYRDILSLKDNPAKGFYFVEKDKYKVENSIYTNRNNFIPKVGDLVIFKWNDAGSNITFSHVGIVTKVENPVENPERITVIHGNTDKSDVGKWYPLNFRKNNSEVVAFVRPNYGAISDEWTGKIKHSFECPVDVCVIFDGEELNSATDSTVTSFGTMTIEEDCITVILDYGNPYNIVVTGKDEGTMKLTTEFDTNHGQNTRSFIDIPITKNTTIHVYADAATAGIELLVEPNDAETTETIWYAEPGDTVEKENEELTNELLDESWTENIIISIREDKTVIDTDGGTLQLIADIFPEREIEWTVEPITGEAVIDQNGLLTAIKNGTVTVTAATKDGSDIKESIDIIISNQTEWKTWESKYDIALDKTWTVEFNKILDAATVKGNNIYVTDQNNQVVSTSLYQQNNKKVRVIPTKNYQSGHTYILWIKGLKAEDGSLLGENVKMEFTIK